METLLNFLPTAIVLFCGGGGSSLGLYYAGFKELLSVDNDRVAQRSFENNFVEGKYGHVPFLNADIMALSGEDIPTKVLLYPLQLALLVVTAPCQGFSIASGGANPLDKRNGCFLHSITLASQIKPKVILWENVPGMLQPELTSILNEIKMRFRELLPDYKIYCFKVNALYFGCPTDRERLFFVGIHESIFKFAPRFRMATPDIGQFTIANVAPDIELLSFGQSKKVVRFPKHFCPTVTATQGILFYQDGKWVPLAENELYLKRFSTFPDDYSFVEDETVANKCKIIGNGVPPLLMYHIARYIKTKILGYPDVPSLPPTPVAA